MDPLTGLAALNATFAGVKKLIEHGKDIEDVFSSLKRWATTASDMYEWCNEQEKTPSIFKKISFSNTLSSEALDAVMVRRKLEQQETQLRELMMWHGGPGMYEEFIQERRKIKDFREKTIYKQQRMRREFFQNAMYIGAIGGLLTALGYFGVLINDMLK